MSEKCDARFIFCLLSDLHFAKLLNDKIIFVKLFRNSRQFSSHEENLELKLIFLNFKKNVNINCRILKMVLFLVYGSKINYGGLEYPEINS